MHFYKNIPGLIAMLLLLCSCVNLSKPSNEIEYYTLEYNPPDISGIKTLPYILQVERFAVAPFYDTNQMIYRNSSHRRDAYAYHRWRVKPGDLVTYFLDRDIRYSGLFKAVLPRESRSAPSIVIGGMVDEFVEWDTVKNWEARLSLSIILKQEKGSDVEGKVLYQKAYNVSEVCKSKSPDALAEAMSQAMAQVSKEIQRDIHEYLDNN